MPILRPFLGEVAVVVQAIALRRIVVLEVCPLGPAHLAEVLDLQHLRQRLLVEVVLQCLATYIALEKGLSHAGAVRVRLLEEGAAVVVLLHEGPLLLLHPCLFVLEGVLILSQDLRVCQSAPPRDFRLLPLDSLSLVVLALDAAKLPDLPRLVLGSLVLVVVIVLR